MGSTYHGRGRHADGGSGVSMFTTANSSVPTPFSGSSATPKAAKTPKAAANRNASTTFVLSLLICPHYLDRMIARANAIVFI